MSSAFENFGILNHHILVFPDVGVSEMADHYFEIIRLRDAKVGRDHFWNSQVRNSFLEVRGRKESIEAEPC